MDSRTCQGISDANEEEKRQKNVVELRRLRSQLNFRTREEEEAERAHVAAKKALEKARESIIDLVEETCVKFSDLEQGRYFRWAIPYYMDFDDTLYLKDSCWTIYEMGNNHRVDITEVRSYQHDQLVIPTNRSGSPL